MAIECPHCGRDLEEVGVIELRGYLEYPNADGEIPFDNRLNRPCDDTEGYLCGHCSEELDWDDKEYATVIHGR